MQPFQFTVTAAMRLLSLLLLGAFSVPAFAAQPLPANLEPLPAPPAFTPEAEASDEPQVDIKPEKTQQTAVEYRVGGRLYMIQVTTSSGATYYLVDEKGDGKFARQESLDSGLRAPQWIIKRF